MQTDKDHQTVECHLRALSGGDDYNSFALCAAKGKAQNKPTSVANSFLNFFNFHPFSKNQAPQTPMSDNSDEHGDICLAGDNSPDTE